MRRKISWLNFIIFQVFALENYLIICDGLSQSAYETVGHKYALKRSLRLWSHEYPGD